MTWSCGYGRRLMFQRCEFESRHHILDGNFFTLICWKKIIMCVWKDENKWKRGRGCPNSKKIPSVHDMLCLIECWHFSTNQSAQNQHKHCFFIGSDLVNFCHLKKWLAWFPPFIKALYKFLWANGLLVCWLDKQHYNWKSIPR